MDELHLSQNILKLISGPWQQDVTGHLVVTTRRKTRALVNDIRGFQDSCCIQLECFDPEEAKAFLFNRTGIPRGEESDPIAGSLVAELGGLPLALEQAGAYIKSLDCSLPLYLQSYKTMCLRLLNQQKASPISMNESQERLAVQTTWVLNFEHIKKNIEGENAVRFLNACAFLNPNKIQQELINVGEPFVDDERFRDFVGTPLGCHQVVKMLTDFSLFKESQEHCLSVHRLVQEVIHENLNPDEKAESLVDAVRMLRHAFSKCSSPDELLYSVAGGRQQRESINSTDPSLFYRWSRLCLHGHEVSKHVEKFVKQSSKATEKTIFFSETARVVYECALHLSVNCRHEEAKQVVNFAYRILDWVPLGKHEVSVDLFKTLFPHILPLPEIVRRHIQYSCKAPVAVSNTGDTESVQTPLDSSESGELEKMRLEGNRLFKEGHFEDSVEVYSRAISLAKGTGSFDPRFLSNRASAYLKLEQYENALKDAEDYILLSPECWKGYARKALALTWSGDELNAKCFAALAFYRERGVFQKYPPFKVFGDLDKYISVCESTSQLLAAILATSPFHLSFTLNELDKIILLEPGKYVISSADLGSSSIPTLLVTRCILWGNLSGSVSSSVSLEFKENCVLNLEERCAVTNIDFKFDQGQCGTNRNGSIVRLSNCSFTCANETCPAFQVLGQLHMDICSFRNCKAGGLLVCGTGMVEVRNSVCSGNGKSGLEVREGGRMVVTNCDLFCNRQGLLIGPAASQCSLINSQVHDNKVEGVMVTEESTDVVLRGNWIFHNDHYGISVGNSFAIIEDNDVFDNCLWGIWIQANSWCRVSRNKVFRNKLGGIRVGMRDGRAPVGETSVVEFNKIFDNGGPGIDEKAATFDVAVMRNSTERFKIDLYSVLSDDFSSSSPDLKKAKCKGNELSNNKELTGRKGAALASPVKLCSYCQKEGDLKKCAKCFTTEYCGKDCQKHHRKAHRNICPAYLETFSVLADLDHKGGKAKECTLLNTHRPGLDPVGPKYCDPPQQDGTRFIVKVQTTDRPFSPSLDELFVYDRSHSIYGYWESSHVSRMVREYGEICQRKYVEKKLFFWALSCKTGKLRIFTNEFAPFQCW